MLRRLHFFLFSSECLCHKFPHNCMYVDVESICVCTHNLCAIIDSGYMYVCMYVVVVVSVYFYVSYVFSGLFTQQKYAKQKEKKKKKKTTVKRQRKITYAHNGEFFCVKCSQMSDC